MLRKIFLASALGLAGAAAFAAEIPPLPNDTLDTNDPRVQAHYQGQCATWAEEQKLNGEALTQFLAECRQDMSEMRPVGFDNSEGGSE